MSSPGLHVCPACTSEQPRHVSASAASFEAKLQGHCASRRSILWNVQKCMSRMLVKNNYVHARNPCSDGRRCLACAVSRTEAAAGHARLSGVGAHLLSPGAEDAAEEAAAEAGDVFEPAASDVEPSADAAPSVVPLPGTIQPHRLSTAIRSRSSALKVDAFLSNRCFLRRSFFAWDLASSTFFCAAFMASAASRIASSKSMIGFLGLFFVSGLVSAAGAGSRGGAGLCVEEAAWHANGVVNAGSAAASRSSRSRSSSRSPPGESGSESAASEAIGAQQRSPGAARTSEVAQAWTVNELRCIAGSDLVHMPARVCRALALLLRRTAGFVSSMASNIGR